jgi:hypothetical protein
MTEHTTEGQMAESRATRIEVTDLYDAFHELADLAWRRFHYRRHRADAPEIGPPFTELIDQLQSDLFLPACARRVLGECGVELDPDEVEQHLELADAAGRPLPGEAGRYHFHGFDYGEPYDEAIENLVVGADLTTRERPAVRLFVVLQPGDS